MRLGNRLGGAVGTGPFPPRKQSGSVGLVCSPSDLVRLSPWWTFHSRTIIHKLTMYISQAEWLKEPLEPGVISTEILEKCASDDR